MKETLQAQQLSVAYDTVQALSDISVEVPKGHIVTVIGPNGAGKTTLLSAMMGVLPVQSGTVTLSGTTLKNQNIEQRVAQGVILVPEKRELFAEMSVLDNLLLGAFYRHRKGDKQIKADLEMVYSLFPRLEERQAQWATHLSGGERQMLALGRALMAKPNFLLLDEPSLGLAPRIVQDIFHIIEELRARGVGILLVEQNAKAALQVADYAYVLESGRLVLEGTATALQDHPDIAKSYLGQRTSHQ